MNTCRLTTSYITMYPHVRRKLNKSGIQIENYSEPEVLCLFEKVAEVAKKFDIKIYSCASPLLEKINGIEKGACIDATLLEGLFGGKLSKARDTGQRKECGCHKSIDIGDYKMKCGCLCTYCYSANT